MEIFIALFGCLYLLYKFSADKAALRDCERSMRARRERSEYYKKKYEAGYELRKKTEEYLLSGDNFDEICARFEEDFRFVLGDGWRKKLEIPPDCWLSEDELGHPQNHATWVYRLLLADIGKMDDIDLIFGGFDISYTREHEMCYRFTQCIEKRLNAHGDDNIRFVREIDYRGAPYLDFKLKIEDLCVGETKRMWGNDADTD